MTTLDNRPNTALLVIDVQNGVVGEAHDRDRVVTNMATLVDRRAPPASGSSGSRTTATRCRATARAGSTPLRSAAATASHWCTSSARLLRGSKDRN